MTILPQNATDNTTPQNWQLVRTGLLLLGILCALFLATQYFVQHSRVATAAAGDDLQVPPPINTTASAAEPDVNLAILKVAH